MIESVVIRRAQQATFDEPARQAFEQTVRRHVRGACPQRVSGFDDELLSELVAAGFERGRAHGLTWESSLLDFVSLMFNVAPDFDKHPKASAILRDASLDPHVRMAALYEQMSQKDWAEAANSGATAAWFAS